MSLMPYDKTTRVVIRFTSGVSHRVYWTWANSTLRLALGTCYELRATGSPRFHPATPEGAKYRQPEGGCQAHRVCYGEI